jgi:hypothetical protein
LAPRETQAKVISALSNNLDEDQEGKDFERRAKIAELMLQEENIKIKREDIASNERITAKQMESKKSESDSYMSRAADLMQ